MICRQRTWSLLAASDALAPLAGVYAVLKSREEAIVRIVNGVLVSRDQTSSRYSNQSGYIVWAIVYDNEDLKPLMPPLNMIKRICPDFIPRKFTGALTQIRQRGRSIGVCGEEASRLRAIVSSLSGGAALQARSSFQ